MHANEFYAINTLQQPWEERFNEKLGRALFRKMLYTDPESGMEIRLVCYPAGVINPLHTHPCGHGMYVLDGQLSVQVGESTVLADAGTYVVVPKDIEQSFTNIGAAPCRFLTLFMPGGNEQFFEDAYELARAADGAPSPADLHALQARYALEYL